MSVTNLSRDTGGNAVAAFERAHAELAVAKRRQFALLLAAFAVAFGFSAWVGEVRPGNFLEGLPGLANYIGDTVPLVRRDSILADLSEWYWNLGGWLLLLFDTLVIAFLGTLLGLIGALVLCFPASRNLVGGRIVYFVARRLTEIARAVPELVYALIFVYAFGLGALPGVLAIAVHTAGALGKLFAEVNENIDMRPVDGVLAAGGGWLHKIRYAVIPQVLPNQLSYTLLRFEINVRSAAVIGFVGAGGIGQELMFVVRQFVYADISAIVLLIILSVVLIDMSCEWLRHRLIGAPA